jgi:predicted nucleotidyltransferase
VRSGDQGLGIRGRGIRPALNIPKLGFIIPNMGIKKLAVREPRASYGLADALFSKVQQRVLGVLFGNPDRSFFANEIITLANSGTGAVQRELARLEGAGLLNVKRLGRQKHYQANAAAPVFAELRDLVMKTSGLADVLRAALSPLAEKIAAAFVYGSIAKGESTPASDVDVMIVSDELTYSDVFSVLEEAGNRLGRKVNPTVYSRKELHFRIKSPSAFMTRVLAQPKIWLMGDDGVISTR